AAELAITFNGNEYGGFTRSASTLAGSFVTGLARANIGFIKLNRSCQFRCVVIWCHCKPNAIHEEQSRLVADLALPFDLKGRDTLLRSCRTPERIAPVAKWNP